MKARGGQACDGGGKEEPRDGGGDSEAMLVLDDNKGTLEAGGR